jgi:hypothetical protein
MLLAVAVGASKVAACVAAVVAAGAVAAGGVVAAPGEQAIKKPMRARQAALLEKFFIFLMATDPNPKDSFFDFYSQHSILDPHAGGPKSTDSLVV